MDTDRTARDVALERLDALVGRSSMDARFPDALSSAPMGHAVFEWLPGGQFLSQRWEVPHPDAPDGIAIIGLTADREAYTQHYFDSRGVARLYTMTFGAGIWTLLRETPDFSPLDFSQRFLGTLTQDGSVIHGRWESSGDGSTWAQDFELRYTKAE
jgi:hypothetical protein